LTSKIRSNSSSGRASTGPGTWLVAPLLKATSRRPNASTVRRIAAGTLEGSARSQATYDASPPAAHACSVTATSSSSERAASMTRAPSLANSRAAAAPIPRPAPEMNATLKK
jgi:hypothetical protein